MSINKWQSAGTTGNNLHPELVKLSAEVGVTPVKANGRNQCYINSIWVGYYDGYGATPWQLGDARVCVQREAIVALLTKGDEPVVVSQSARVRKDIAGVLAAASAEAPAPVPAPIAAIVAPVVETAAEKIARLEAAVAAKKAAKAAVAATEAEAARIAELEAELGAE